MIGPPLKRSGKRVQIPSMHQCIHENESVFKFKAGDRDKDWPVLGVPACLQRARRLFPAHVWVLQLAKRERQAQESSNGSSYSFGVGDQTV